MDGSVGRYLLVRTKALGQYCGDGMQAGAREVKLWGHCSNQETGSWLDPRCAVGREW